MTNAPSPFSQHNPALQVVWDATSYGQLLNCPRSYQYRIVMGYAPPGNSVDLHFGGLYASAVEVFSKSRLAGNSKEEATIDAVQWVVENSGHYEEDTHVDTGDIVRCWFPWGGRYEDHWRCTGTEPYKNEKGNKAKCPLSHKGVWQEDTFAPSACHVCGSPAEVANRWVPDDKVKNRYTLVRLVAGYCDSQPEHGGIQPMMLPGGKPAVELSFAVPLPLTNPYGEPYVLAGYLDRLVTFGDEVFFADNKTTKHQLHQGYFAQWTPNVQMDTYDLITSVAFPASHISGGIVEAAQVTQSAVDYAVGILHRSDEQREEYLEDFAYWMSQAEHFAETGKWPMNRKSCYMCPYKVICAMKPAARDDFLKANFEYRPWNPLEER